MTEQELKEKEFREQMRNSVQEMIHMSRQKDDYGQVL
jgi:hypothetical protein